MVRRPCSVNIIMSIVSQAALKEATLLLMPGASAKYISAKCLSNAYSPKSSLAEATPERQAVPHFMLPGSLELLALLDVPFGISGGGLGYSIPYIFISIPCFLAL